MDGDGDLDIFMQNGIESTGYTFQVWLNDGAANFTSVSASLPALDIRREKTLFGDVDNDGDSDLVVEVSDTYSSIFILQNNRLDLTISKSMTYKEWHPYWHR